jgi:hypothetical protein
MAGDIFGAHAAMRCSTAIGFKKHKEAQMAKKQSNDVLWLVDENGHRTFTVSKDAWDALHGDEINRVAAPAMAGVLTTMRAQPSLHQ